MAPITSIGVGSGLPLENMIQQLVDSEKVPAKARMDLKAKEVTAKISGFSTLKNSLESFQSTLTTLKDVTTFQGREATSSNPDAVAVSASKNAGVGSFEISVEKLATAHKVISSGFTDASSPVGTGDITVSSGAGSFTVTIDSLNNSVAGIRDAINEAADNFGVTASLINVDDGAGGTETKLIFSADDTGVDNQLTIAISGDVDGNDTDMVGLSRLTFDKGVTENMLEQQQATDSLAIIDGQTITSASNTLDSVLENMSITLLEAAPGVKNTITVAENKEAAREAVENFVSSYNSLLGVTNTLTSYDDEKDEAGILLGDPLLRGTVFKMRGIIGQPVSAISSDFSTLAAIGLSTEKKDGTLRIDNDKFTEVLENNFDDISKLFATEEGEGGIARRLDNMFEDLTKFGGTIDTRKNSLNSMLTDLDEEEKALDKRLSGLETRLRVQFSSMDQLVSQLNATSDYLTQQLANLPGFSNKK